MKKKNLKGPSVRSITELLNDNEVNNSTYPSFGKSVSIPRSSERIPTESRCIKCYVTFVVYRHVFSRSFRTYDVCCNCAAKDAARLYPKMKVLS